MDIKKKWAELLGKYMNTRAAVIIVIIGVVLMCIPSGGAKKADSGRAEPDLGEISAQSYIKETEKRLCSILSTISGVSDVSVMITVSDGGVSLYEKDKSMQTDASNSSLSLKSQGAGQEEPVLVKKSLPTVLGVLVTAKGADNPEKNSQIMSAVKAVLNVSAHRISVLSK